MKINSVGLNDVWRLRHQVMWPHKELDFVRLKDDPEGLHFGMYLDDRLVSVISLFLEGSRAQFRKFATLTEEQGKGYGSKLLAYAAAVAKERGAERFWCNARKDKVNFYRKFGLQETGRAFEKEGIAYVILEKQL